MRASIFITTGIISFVLVAIGIFLNLFLIYGFGLTGAGLAFIIFSLIVNKDWYGFKRLLKIKMSGLLIGLYRLLFLVIGALALVGAFAFWLDFPSYIKKEYSVLEGIPSKMEYEKPTKGEVTPTIIITINQKRLPLNPTPHVSIEKMSGHYFVINYLPHTEWIIDYTIEGVQR